MSEAMVWELTYPVTGTEFRVCQYIEREAGDDANKVVERYRRWRGLLGNPDLDVAELAEIEVHEAALPAQMGHRVFNEERIQQRAVEVAEERRVLAEREQ